MTIRIDEKNYSQHLLNEIRRSDVENYLCVELKTTLQAISTEISRTSAEVYKNKYKASSYTFRHAFAEDLKNAKYDKENIAIALGHRSIDSQSAYGYKQKSSSGVKQEIGIENTSNDKIKTQSKLDKFKIKNKIKKHSFDASKKNSFVVMQQKTPKNKRT